MSDLSGVYVTSKNESGLMDVALMSVEDDLRLYAMKGDPSVSATNSCNLFLFLVLAMEWLVRWCLAGVDI